MHYRLSSGLSRGPSRTLPALVLLASLTACCSGPAGRASPLRAAGPNVILYLIDGAAAERMSVYGYGRRTTPCLERLAAEGVLFENAYSNSSFTKTSVPSLMTSLHSSVLGGSRSAAVVDPLPERAATLAERMRRSGYRTEILASNPYCGRISGLDRGVDFVREYGLGHSRPPSVELDGLFQRLRADDPSAPYWVHFQPTDLHSPWETAGDPAWPRGLSGGLAAFDGPGEEAPAESTDLRLVTSAGDLYDRCLVLQDASLGRLVERLKENGDWERTLLIVSADHGHFAAGLPLYAADAPAWPTPVLASHKSRIPLIFVWPGHIGPGRRLSEQVSLIDLLPTVLDLAGLPPSRSAQGRSLAPLLLGKKGWKHRPVVFDEFFTDGKDRWGNLEIIDGRWGASLRIDTRPAKLRPERQRPAPLLVFDIEQDPHALKAINAGRPDLVEKYEKVLGRLWKEQRALAGSYRRPGPTQLTPVQAEALRSLGYIR